MKTRTKGNLALCFGMLLGLILCTGGIIWGHHEIELNQRARLIRQCDELDSALDRYASYHREANKKIYPKELSALGAVYDDEAGFFENKNVDFSQFDYEAKLDKTTGEYIYRLGTHLPGGYYYKSKKSHE